LLRLFVVLEVVLRGLVAVTNGLLRMTVSDQRATSRLGVVFSGVAFGCGAVMCRRLFMMLSRRQVVL
jgi:hypothetical protein